MMLLGHSATFQERFHPFLVNVYYESPKCLMVAKGACGTESAWKRLPLENRYSQTVIEKRS